MDNKLLLGKSATLLYRESQLADRSENSSELVRTVLENVQVSDIGIGINSDREVINALKTTILEMCSMPQDHVYDVTDLLQRFKINCGNDEKLYEAIKQGIVDEMSEASLKRSVVNIRRSINNHFREQKLNEVLHKASRTIKFEREKVKDVNQFITELMAQLEPLQINGNGKDPAVMGDLDIGNEQSMRDLFAEVKKLNTGVKLYKTGWQGFNRMTQGGLRPGETVVINALQHKYKTGFTLSLFKQLALYNRPHTEDPTKKPLLLRISFEDDLVSNLQFLYQNLKYNETMQPVDLENVTVDEMSAYVKEKLQVNGFHIKMLRVDPTQWTYRSVCNKIIELEAQGYNVEVLMLDYLMLLPTTGCINTGPGGTDMRDMLRRMRNFCASKKILFITPHQLSTEAKQLIRGGTPEDQFVKEIAEKGYFSGSKQLDQEMDLEIYIHLFKHNRETYFAVQRGKHRLPTIVNDDDKYYLMKFDKGVPLADDANGEDRSFPRLKAAPSNASEDLFKLG